MLLYNRALYLNGDSIHLVREIQITGSVHSAELLGVGVNVNKKRSN